MTLVQSRGDGKNDGQEIHGSWQKLPQAAAKRHFTCSSKQHRLHPAKSSNTRPLRLTTSHPRLPFPRKPTRKILN